MADPRFLAAVLADRVAESRTIAVGTNSPIPAAATLLAQMRRPRTIISILGSARHNPFTDGGRELFDFAAQGRLDAFFLGGGQIDGEANIGLLCSQAAARAGIPCHPTDVRLATANGSATKVLGISPPLLITYGAGPLKVQAWHYFLITEGSGHRPTIRFFRFRV